MFVVEEHFFSCLLLFVTYIQILTSSRSPPIPLKIINEWKIIYNYPFAPFAVIRELSHINCSKHFFNIEILWVPLWKIFHISNYRYLEHIIAMKTPILTCHRKSTIMIINESYQGWCKRGMEHRIITIHSSLCFYCLFIEGEWGGRTV